jgi:anaerobic C4-dicarboxylate transporter
VGIFLSAAAIIMAFGMVEWLRPKYSEVVIPAANVPVKEIDRAVQSLIERSAHDDTLQTSELAERLKDLAHRPAEKRDVHVSMSAIIQIVMYCAAGVMMLIGASASRAITTSVASAGVVAVVSIVGLGWMGNCFFEGNRPQIVEALSDTITHHPWVFAVGLFGLSIMLFSQASTVAALVPLGIALAIPAKTLIAFFPAVNGYFFLPTYGTIVAAIAFDQTGTTRVGKYVLNHSFMLPGLVSTAAAIGIGMLISRFVF